MDQYTLDFDQSPQLTKESYLVSDSNKNVCAVIELWPKWDSNIIVVQGEYGSGKTHLAHIFREMSGATLVSSEVLNSKHYEQYSHFVLDNVTYFNELDVFHLFNHCVQENKSLLITSEKNMGKIQWELPDLASRLKSVPQFSIGMPDDQLMEMLLVKQLSERQLRISPAVLNYVLPRLTRSYVALNQFVNIIDKTSFIEGKNITIPLIKKVLEQTN